jgi:hypothetical protein
MESYSPLIPAHGLAQRAAITRIRATLRSGTTDSASAIMKNPPSQESRDQSRSTKSPLWYYIDQRLGRLIREHYDHVGGEVVPVDRDAALSLHSVLQDICVSSSVFPFISSDGEGGVAATWRADDRVIQIVADTDGEIWALTQKGQQDPLIVDISDKREHISNIREDLAELTKQVNRENPRWREIFSGGR